MSRRDLVLMAVVVALLVAAGVLYSRLGSSNDAPRDQFVGFYCPPCDDVFPVSYAELDRLDAADVGPHPKCPKCGQTRAVRADSVEEGRAAAAANDAPPPPGAGG